MRFYSNVAQHIQQVITGLGVDVGITPIDRADINLDTGMTQISYTIGDIDPIGYNHLGQESNQIEIEFQVFVPTSKETYNEELTPQLYAAALSAKVAGLLKSNHYGFDDQRETPEIEQNAALDAGGSNSHEKRLSWVVRSVVMSQVVFTGRSIMDLYELGDIQLKEVNPYEQ